MALKIIIIGSGPSGCYVAQSLRKMLPECELTIMDQLPVPYGLVRYGVAPDHQGTKAVTKQFARLFERQNVQFFGNISLGQDVEMDALTSMFDVVVMATGLSKDRIIDDNFTGLPNIYGAGQITRLWNAHPFEAEFEPRFGKKAIVLGNGNVALDIVRLLAKGPEDFAGSDINSDELCMGIEEIHLVGRSQADKAKFDPAMMRELIKIEHLSVQLAEGSHIEDYDDNKQIAAINDVVEHSTGKGEVTLTLHFGLPVKTPVIEDGKLTAIEFDREGALKTIFCDSVISAIGFDDDGSLGRDELLSKAIDIDNGHLADGLYAAGWFRRGPQGTIPENRQDAQKVAAQIVSDFKGQANGSDKPGFAALHSAFKDKAISYEDWQIIDQAERDNAGQDRIRKKMTNVPEMLALITDN